MSELESVNDDLTNALASSELAMIGVDRRLAIRWFTPAAERLLKLLPKDKGETVAGLDTSLGGNVARDAKAVLREEKPIEREVRGANDEWILRRMLPYRDGTGRVTGVVLTLTNIDRQKTAEADLKLVNQTLEQQVAERIWLAKLLYEVTVIANETTHLNEALRQSLARLCLRLGWALGHAFVRERGAEGYFVDSGIWHRDRTEHFDDFVRATSDLRFRAGEGLPGLVAASGKPVIVEDVGECADFARPLTGASGARLRGAMAIPLLVGRDVIGVLELFTTERARVDRAQLDGLEQIGVQLGRVAERARAHEELQRVSSELLRAEERERRKIAADLHDDLGQLLTLALVRIDTLRGRGEAELATGLAEIRDAVDRANQATRSLMYQMSPPILHELGLVPALEWLGDQMEQIYGLEVALRDDGEAKPLNDEIGFILFRCVRELLVNVAKHAGVKRAFVEARRRDGHVSIFVTDRGVGFDPNAEHLDGFGLASVRERLQYVGGRLHIVSRLGKGTRVGVEAPLEGT